MFLLTGIQDTDISDSPSSSREKEWRVIFYPKNREKSLISFENYALLVYNTPDEDT